MTEQKEEIYERLKKMTKAELLEYTIAIQNNHDVHVKTILSLTENITTMLDSKRADEEMAKVIAEDRKNDIRNAKHRIIHFLTDPYGSGGIDKIKELFWALNSCSQGYIQGQGKSGMIGYLDDSNREHLAIVLSDRDTMSSIARALYYNTLTELCDHRQCEEDYEGIVRCLNCRAKIEGGE